MNQIKLHKTICFTLLMASLLISSCLGNGRRTSDTQAKRSPAPFTVPSIPPMLTNNADRADFLAKNYWNNFDFSDTLLIGNQQITEQAFVNYLDIWPHVSEGALRLSISRTLEKAQVEPKMFIHFTDLFEKYLYDPNSAMRNEEYYAMVLDYIITSPSIDELYKIQPKFYLELINKNRLGTIATDFVYTMANGKQGSMHKIKSEYLIIFFNNPGCSACIEYEQGLEYSPVVTKMLETGKLKILAMYVDEDIYEWDKNRPNIPASWINGYDAFTTIRKNNSYDLRAIPNLYLLDKEKRVIMKDAMPHLLEEQLVQILQNAI